MIETSTMWIRLIPVAMVILGIVGVIFGGMYSASMIVGAGIGSPTGSPDDSYYITASWIIGIPAFVFLVGALWVVIGFLTAPASRGPSISRNDVHD